MDDPEPTSLLINLLNLINPEAIQIGTFLWLSLWMILLACSALVSGSEVAYFSINAVELDDIRKSESKKDKLIARLLADPNRLLATILISNNFINIAIILISTFLIKRSFTFPNAIVGFAIEVISVTFILLLVGEIAPKIYATEKKKRVASITSIPFKYLMGFFRPLSSILIRSTKVIEKRLQKIQDNNISSEEISQAIDLAFENAADTEEHKILSGIVQFGNTDVKQIMRSRMDVLAIEISTSFESVMKTVVEAGYSRIPVYKESLDQIEGILFVKDLLPYIEKKENIEWRKLVRKATFVPENKKIDDLLEDFQQSKSHLAIVVDEYGGTSGIVTLEDIIEEIVGEIKEDDSDENAEAVKVDDRTFEFDGKIPLVDVCKVMSIDQDFFEKDKGESDTIAGFITEISGKIPKKNEKIKYGNVQFLILASNVKKIVRVQVKIKQDGKRK